MDNSGTLRIIEDYYRMLKARDREGLLGILAPNISIRYYGPEGALPWIGKFCGHAGFDKFLGIIASHLDIVEVARLATIADQRKVVVQTRGLWRSRTTGKEIHGNMVNIFTVEQGKISGYEVYNDTLAFARGMQEDQR